jgi:hypothetical protein
VSTSGLPPVAIRCEQETRPHDVLRSRTELGRCSERLLDRGLRLQESVAGVQDPVLVERRSAAHRDVVPVPHGTGVGGDFAEAAAIPDSFPHYGLKVIVLCVLMAPFAYFQIS